MRKDIEFPIVEGIKIVIARSVNELNQTDWDVYLINRLEDCIEKVFITSRGFGLNKDGQEQKTSLLRHFYERLEPGTIIKVEPITPEVFHLNNEYWVSYYIGNKIFDKKFLFVPDSIKEEFLTKIEDIKDEVILHA